MKRDSLGRVISRPLEDRFIERVKEPFDAHNDCFEWTGAKTGSGYGQIWLDANRRECAHRIAYELFVGPIPEGYHVDHLCRNRGCVRPDHLEAIPRKENVSQWNLSKTHCKNGHEYSEANTYRYRGERQCKICRAGALARAYRKKRGVLTVGPWNGNKTHCKHGHEFSEANTYRYPDGERACRTCHNLQNADYRQRKAV